MCADADKTCGRSTVDNTAPKTTRAQPTQDAKLTIIAKPWAFIRIDGKPVGGTPNVYSVPAGHHIVELTYYPGDEPYGHSLSRTFAIDVELGEAKSLFTDFMVK